MSTADQYGLEVYYQCIGALSLLGGALALRMSLFRMAGSPGENDARSPLNRTSEMQLLTAEWNPVGITLMLALILRRDTSYLATLFAALFTAGRFLFTLRLYAPEFAAYPVGFIGMNLTYATTFGLACRLLQLF